jgi:hypothetical protein
VIERIRHLASRGLLSMMVLSNFLSRRIALLQSCIRPGWQLNREVDTTWLEHGRGSDLALDVLRTLLRKMSPNPSSTDFVTPLLVYTSLCSDQATRMRLLRWLPTLDDINIAMLQKGNLSQGV